MIDVQLLPEGPLVPARQAGTGCGEQSIGSSPSMSVRPIIIVLAALYRQAVMSAKLPVPKVELRARHEIRCRTGLQSTDAHSM